MRSFHEHVLLFFFSNGTMVVSLKNNGVPPYHGSSRAASEASLFPRFNNKTWLALAGGPLFSGPAAPYLLRVWLCVCHLLFVKPAVCVRKPSVRATTKLCFRAPVEVIRQNLSCAFTASQVCVTVVGFGFTLRQTSSLYGCGNREKRQPLIVVLESTRV